MLWTGLRLVAGLRTDSGSSFLVRSFGDLKSPRLPRWPFFLLLSKVEDLSGEFHHNQLYKATGTRWRALKYSESQSDRGKLSLQTINMSE